ncbi:hypothetical protein CEXT_176231 [Caerostris extrusa]|uniref:Ribosomal protein S4 n=1 Tax=Caerostris extrusa TaxID=172846 RepID=A0AAV4URU1_CAEEX|nr:hypothetical protein CEXT_176231 [Caerostris extrusa]
MKKRQKRSCGTECFMRNRDLIPGVGNPWQKEGKFSFEFQILFFIGSAAALLCGGFSAKITRRISRRNSRKLFHRPKRKRTLIPSLSFNRERNAPVLHVYDAAKAVRYERLSKTGKICAPGLMRDPCMAVEVEHLAAKLGSFITYFQFPSLSDLSNMCFILLQASGRGGEVATDRSPFFPSPICANLEITLHEARSRFLRSITLSDFFKVNSTPINLSAFLSKISHAKTENKQPAEPKRQVFKKARKFLAAGRAVNCHKFLIFPGQKFRIKSPPIRARRRTLIPSLTLIERGNAPVLHVYDTAKAVRYERLSKAGKICAPGLERPLALEWMVVHN